MKGKAKSGGAKREKGRDMINRSNGGGKRKHRKVEKDESDREAEEVKEEITELQKQVDDKQFEAFSSSSSEEPTDEEDQEIDEDQSSQEENAPEFQIEGQFFGTLLKDLRLYELRLTKLKTLLSSSDLSSPGREFVHEYHNLVSVYCLYLMFYMHLASQKGIKAHPILRTLSNLRPKVKELDKEYAKHKSEAVSLIEQVEAGIKSHEGEEEDSDEGDENIEGHSQEVEKMDQEFVSEDDQPVNPPSSKPRIKNKPLKKGIVQKKVQVFQLEAPKSYSDIHQYISYGEDEDDGVLNLGGGKTNRQEDSGEITMADMKAYQKSMAEPKTFKKPSKKGQQLYKEISEAKTQSKSLANALREESERVLDEYERKLMFNERKVKADQPRKLTEDMLLNRGLRSKRKNEISKVKLRRKYEKAKLQDRVRKGIPLHEEKNRDIHVLRGTGEGVNRAISLN